MASPSFFIAVLALLYVPYLITAQQSSSPNNYDANNTCQSFFIFQAQPPYHTVATIASFFSVNASEISALNNITENTTLAKNTEVIVPVTLSDCGLLMKKKWKYFWSGVALGTAGLSLFGIILLCLLLRKFHVIAKKH